MCPANPSSKPYNANNRNPAANLSSCILLSSSTALQGIGCNEPFSFCGSMPWVRSIFFGVVELIFPILIPTYSYNRLQSIFRVNQFTMQFRKIFTLFLLEIDDVTVVNA